MKPERPSIHITANERITEQQLTDLLLGIEEEGVPVVVHRTEQLNPLTCALDAAVASRLGVGVGVSLDYVVITTEKLPEQRPYIAEFLNQSTAADRIIGSNAARLVKRLPLRSTRDERNHSCKH